MAPTASRGGRSRSRPQSWPPRGHLASISSASARMIAARSTDPRSRVSRTRPSESNVGMTVAGPPHDRRHERQFVVREAIELGAEQDVGHVLVAVHHVEAPADVEDARGMIDRHHDTRRRARLERPLELRGDAPAARRRLSPPSVEPRDERRQRALFHRLGRPDGDLQQPEHDAFTHALTRRPGCVWRARTPPVSEWPRRRRQSNRRAPR